MGTSARLLLKALCAQLAGSRPQHALLMAAGLHLEGYLGCSRSLLGRAAAAQWVYLLSLAKCCSCCIHEPPAPACCEAEGLALSGLGVCKHLTCCSTTLMCAAAEAFQKRQKTTVQAPAAAGIPAAVSLSCCL